MEGDASHIHRKKGSGTAQDVSPSLKAVSPASREKAPPVPRNASGISPLFFAPSGMSGELMEHLPLGMAGRDITGGGRYVFWNAFLEELTGIPRKRVLHFSGEEAFSPDLRAFFQDADVRVIREKCSLDCGILPFPGEVSRRVHMIKLFFREPHTAHHLVLTLLSDRTPQEEARHRARELERALDAAAEREAELRSLLRSFARHREESALERALALLGKGTLPLYGEDIPSGPAAPEEESSRERPLVFLLERDEAVRNFALRILRWENWVVETADSPEALLEVFREKNPESWIFVAGHEDLGLPRGLPGDVVVLRDEAMSPELEAECRRRGDVLCPRPFGARELLECLERFSVPERRGRG